MARPSRTYYEILGIEPGANLEEIRNARTRQSEYCHPGRFDKNQDPEQYRGAEEEMKLINLAYAVLSDPSRRSRYDAEIGISQYEHDSEGIVPIPEAQAHPAHNTPPPQPRVVSVTPVPKYRKRFPVMTVVMVVILVAGVFIYLKKSSSKNEASQTRQVTEQRANDTDSQEPEGPAVSGDSNSITRLEYDSLQFGMSADVVSRKLGSKIPGASTADPGGNTVWELTIEGDPSGYATVKFDKNGKLVEKSWNPSK